MRARARLKACTVVDLFCGVGGLTHGFVKEGFDVAAGLDADSRCKFAYEANNHAKFIHKKLEDVSSEEIASLYPKRRTRILVGCAPCQPFSPYTRKVEEKESWKLLDVFAELIGGVVPDVVSMENVTRLKSFDGGRIYKNFVSRLKAAGYFVTTYSVFCPRYGVPQTRRRLVLFGSRYGPIKLAKSTHTPKDFPTVRSVIGALPEVRQGEVHPLDSLHRAKRLSSLNLQRIRESKPGGTWKDWSAELLLDCYKRESGKTFRNVYGRMVWDSLAPTITTEFPGIGRGRFGHPEQDRAITLREGALLQTFPIEYVFAPLGQAINITAASRHIGNAVPVALGRAIARSIAEHLEASDAR